MNRLLLFFLLLSGFGYTQKYQPQFSTAGFYQTDKSVREAINFNVGWRFIKQDVTGAEKHDFDDSAWSVVNLPDGLELLPLAASGGVNYQGPAWYRKQFNLNETMRSKKVILHFEGIMGKSKIWVNGAMIKENFSGYYPIHIDVTEYVDFKKPNTVAVRADNSNDKTCPPGKSQEQLDFTYFGGIYRDAWLITHNHTYVTHPTAAEKVAGGGVFVHYENLSEKSVDVFVNVDVNNEGKNMTVFVQLELLDSDGKAVASSVKEYQLPKNNAVQTHAQFTVLNPKLWRPDNPQLHDLRVSLKNKRGDVLDTFIKRIGIRTVEMRGQEGFYLNGKPYPQLLIGANRHQDFAHIGHALPNNLHYRDALKLRQTGMRVIRSAHFVQDPAFMDACDELGLLFIATIPGWQFWNKDPIFMERMLDDVRKLIRLERNRPSVFIWEIIPNETHFPEKFAQEATKAAKEEFPFKGLYTVTDAREMRGKNQKYFDMLYSNDLVAKYPNKSIFKREWGDFVDNWVDHNSVSRVAKQWGETAQIRQALHYFKEEWIENGELKTWPSLTMSYAASKSLVGATMWHPFDHQRGYHPDPFWGGIMDAYRQPKFSYYLMKSLLPTSGLEKVPQVDAKPFVFLAHLMTPFSAEDVVVFTNCEEIKLTMYGEEIGVKKATDAANPVPRVPVIFKDVFKYTDVRNKSKKGYGKINQEYVEGAVMKAEGIINGAVVTEHKRWPVGRKRRLVIKVDDSDIQPIADGSDITTVVAYLVDAGGAIKRLSDEYVRFTVEGEGELIGSKANEINPQKMLWGEAIALIRSSTTAGKIKVKAAILKEGMNIPDFAEIEFSTVEASQNLFYNELPNKDTAAKTSLLNDQNEDLEKLQNELRKVQKELQDYKINEVGKQQQQFIQ